jgi:hypothetical protein
MNINEFRERLHELGADSIKKLNEFVSAQNNLFNRKQSWFMICLRMRKSTTEKEWEAI